MELVTGDTLAEKIKRGAIPLDESPGIATQITEALEAAHGKPEREGSFVYSGLPGSIIKSDESI